MPSQKALAEIIRDRIEAMPEEQRADHEAMASRLAHCKACDHLMNGTCVLCGCYVELRAAKKVQRCPDVPGKW
ncbi:MAG: hypothetical protein J1E43_09900 [Christensenellaceae bacterium]|nr:hypothetical protein [Christensenellaceae bacterium]